MQIKQRAEALVALFVLQVPPLVDAEKTTKHATRLEEAAKGQGGRAGRIANEIELSSPGFVCVVDSHLISRASLLSYLISLSLGAAKQRRPRADAFIIDQQ